MKLKKYALFVGMSDQRSTDHMLSKHGESWRILRKLRDRV